MLLFARPFVPGGDLHLMCALQSPTAAAPDPPTRGHPASPTATCAPSTTAAACGTRSARPPTSSARAWAPGPTPGDVLGNDRALDGWIAAHLTTAQHLCGSAAMGRGSSTPSCACTASSGLRVVDISVLPVVPRRGTAATAVAIGEAGAALIQS